MGEYRPHYADPTAAAAIGNVMKEYKQRQREISNRRRDIRSRAKVYIVSRYAGDIKENIKKARKYCRFAVGRRKNPIASHLLYPQFLMDDNEREREIGLQYGLALLEECNEIWCFGEEISAGMQQELEWARRIKKKIRYFTEELEEII